MSGNFKKEDLRIIKTNKALIEALDSLLTHRNFTQITVNDLCEEALISRAAFYSHFNDKYDLLKYRLTTLKMEIIQSEKFTYEQLEKNINYYVFNNSAIIKNLVKNANDEVLDMLHNFMLSLLGVSINENTDRQMTLKYIMFSSFCAGGMLNFLMWQIKNKFPADLQIMNTYSFEILSLLLKWYSEEKKNENNEMNTLLKNQMTKNISKKIDIND